MTTTGPGAGSTAGPPVQRLRYAASDPEDATEFLRAQYNYFEPALRDPTDFAVDFVSEAAVTPIGPLRVDRLRHSSLVHAEVEPYAQLTVVAVLSGRFGMTDRDRQASGVALMPTWERFGAVWHDIDVLSASMEHDTVARVGAELSGLAPGVVAFREMAPVSRERARALAALLAHLKRDLLAHDELMASPLVRAEAARHLAATLLLTFPNTALDALTDPDAPGPGTAEPATVRRAVAFIDDHMHAPIGLDEIAAAAGVGVRGLQHAFRRHRGSSPLEYLRRARLERAHRDLQACDPSRGDTVAAVAARWGFSHHGRFSASYRRTYGLSPGETLRK